ncbi:hypothetical protein DFQ04_3098 [Algoriphagus boseongensis]|uniref:Uncharacterized protein n=1 Tax=Algoriphagus boseongensis TaxID=1442587 RepID=A0A4R6T2G8_9BACT|nr:hypothetical protein [Algoriphagus boseongensis]TDQ15212.1 hypothetical protein DFQ04_3098 [Algoriphagus boseongensis]
MSENSKILYRGSLKIEGISRGIKLWWTEEQIRQWKKIESKSLSDDYVRIKTTPYSMVEFEPCNFERIEFTDEICEAESSIVKESTLWFNHYFSNLIPIPKGSMYDVYTYPCVLIGVNRGIDHDVSYFDYTGYFNFQFLKEDKVDIGQYLKDSNLFDNSRFDLDDFTIVEYSKNIRL